MSRFPKTVGTLNTLMNWCVKCAFWTWFIQVESAVCKHHLTKLHTGQIVDKNSSIIISTEPLRWYGGGKKKIWAGRKNNIGFSSKCFVFPWETLCSWERKTFFRQTWRFSGQERTQNLISSPCPFKGSILYSFIWGHLLGLRMS